MSIPSGQGLVRGGTPVGVLNASSARDQFGGLSCGDGVWNQRCEGLCTLDVSVTDMGPIPDIAVPAVDNSALKLRVTYRSGRAGGELLMDAPVGGLVTVGAVDVVSVVAFYESTLAGVALTPARQMMVECSAHWSTSRDGLVATYSAPGVAAAAAPGGSPFVAVPPKAARMGVMVAAGVGFNPVVAEFATRASAADLVYEATLVPGLDQHKAPVVQGARFVRFVGTGNVFPVFYLST